MPLRCQLKRCGTNPRTGRAKSKRQVTAPATQIEIGEKKTHRLAAAAAAAAALNKIDASLVFVFTLFALQQTKKGKVKAIKTKT